MILETKKATLINLTAPSNSGKTGVLENLSRVIEDAGLVVARVKYPVYKPEDYGAIDYLETGKRINSYLREGNPEEWSPIEAQSMFAVNRYFFDIKIREWLKEKDVVLTEDGKHTSMIWGHLMDPDLTVRELRALNDGIIEPDIRFTLNGPRLTGRENGHLMEDSLSALQDESRRMHLDFAAKEGWEVIEYFQYRDPRGIEEEKNRISLEIIHRSWGLFSNDIKVRLVNVKDKLVGQKGEVASVI